MTNIDGVEFKTKNVDEWFANTDHAKITGRDLFALHVAVRKDIVAAIEQAGQPAKKGE